MWDQIDFISKQVALHEQPRTPTFTTANPSFNRAIDPTIIAIRSNKEISREQTVAALEEMLGEMRAERSWYRMEGKDEVGKYHTLRFEGAAGLAANRASKLLGLQKTATGWRSLSAKDAKGEKAEVWISGDTKRKQIRT